MNKMVANCIIIYGVLCLVVVCNAGDLNKPKRGLNDLGLIKFSRIDRSEAVIPLGKLSELNAFPRIGRLPSVPLDRNSPKTINSGNWFSPLLELVQKCNPCEIIADFYNPMAPDEKRLVYYTQHLAKKFDEELD